MLNDLEVVAFGTGDFHEVVVVVDANCHAVESGTPVGIVEKCAYLCDSVVEVFDFGASNLEIERLIFYTVRHKQ